MFITVPFLVVEAPTLTVDSPAEGAQFENGAIPVKGSTTNATTVAVSAVPTPGPSRASRRHPSRPSGGKGAEGRAEDRQGRLATASFETPLDLSAGKWQITVTATSAEGKSIDAHPRRLDHATRA